LTKGGLLYESSWNKGMDHLVFFCCCCFVFVSGNSKMERVEN